ncbi:SDR family NAD(P)-dependent oxidoreductase [Pseudomonas nicosulfuronedens]|uniref:SDR family NAD(P)-dependent oxidoreductase n=1 Tax=Pseudomonas nicosulfuronedens TaxID=2571105 RepID=A0A5R9QTA0_9PSED|nr:SDR family NAD(P)-dependent oxidoreductase [Pseudomonas nicosulfuronedens]MDH1012779.1 SDR family NAD(P)-dependent oxidoreductase [Pseudomonas nicosulfuronedens]MDH1979989.1 SDR family NAD(P)-dependent oxidoreductase [Pseudomonas nicosulfuronedens]MDH2030319.1 SDR family NAD(P)-dependent oxidoreductase [Pseudomonas nicosulfuronedens]TLX72486.1 SDR family NAD(P)-dependent oxidoreductase [Pseudomonas nicosulfuronedens]
MNLDNQVAVLTGAASGIGRALAEQLAGKGCHLALVDRDEAGLRETLARLPRTGRHVSLHVLDLAQRDAVRTLPEQVLQEHPTVHLVINNAGVAVGGSFDRVSEEDFDWLMAINFQAVVDITRGFLPVLQRNGARGKFVNVSSLYGLVSPPGQAAYSASKFAVRGFSNSLRHELRGSSVDMMVVHPGGIATSIATNAKAPKDIDPAEVERQRKEMNRLLRMPPSKAAGIILNGIEKDRARVIVGIDALILSIIERLVPVNYWGIVERLMNQRGRAR